MDTWYFELVGIKRDEWVWTRVGASGSVVAESKEGFSYYLNALDDARQQGFVGPPQFGAPPSSVVHPADED